MKNTTKKISTRGTAGVMHSMHYMINVYHHFSASHVYFFGFILNGKIYGFTCKTLPRCTFRMERGSKKNGAYVQVKFRPNKAWKVMMIESGKAFYLCTEEEFMAINDYSKGDKFEQWVNDTYTTDTWKKNSLRFDRGGDVVINGVNVQVKFEGADVINEGTLHSVQYDHRMGRA